MSNVAKFQEIGVNRLYLADSIYELNKTFERTCFCCAMRNMPINCDKCGVSYHHILLATTFNDNNNE